MKENIDPRLYFLMRRVKENIARGFPGQAVNLLDIGCADGSFLTVAKKSLNETGRVDGLDVPSRWCSDIESDAKSAVYRQDLQDGIGKIPAEHYHAVTMWEVIEHIENGYSFLRNAMQIMKPGGVIFLSSPNLLGLSRFIKRNRWVGITEADHKYLFDTLSMAMLLERAGFVSIDVKAYFLPSLGPAWDGLNKVLSKIPGGGMLFARAVKPG
ncbi:MAG: hypothetical protein A2293_10485 [Elusimicrobia bacterium RIFOXYB2_FULL_49_7]|nr:MAG: hypothetical protein A2293_10485 [Elusimicrobia bacterium RIFOXYB2_FULL_49_7]